MSFVIATFYQFVELSNYYDMKDAIGAVCNNVKLKGTVLLAEEGINATVSGARGAIDRVFDFLRSDYRLKDLVWKESTARFQPFSKMKVRLKREIVNLGIRDLDISFRGKYIDPEHWDNFISQPDVLVIDIRNEYEIKLGKFKNAINPNTQYFREFPQWAKSFLKNNKDFKIAMYCTGGVRCEKSTAYVKSIGFNDVYHLKGGILSYLEKTNNRSGNWEGECFVFDDRIAVNNLLTPSDKIECISCSNRVPMSKLELVSRGQVVCSDCKLQKLEKKLCY
ncbi:rhodanese-related sulfurtransferase [Wolbachia endosymbiont of Cruorifilaria tuberocauda]|uniref:oxygen-dependent tRNA uridine(34) hydroxylase TrhO n=1 Tax=Wolbachia endosymbiont of Cruorifilaria tuberocauda TaxID=1812111 RepID=UPI001589F73E|nr:rhodanese-related sulfurtransferase [Wolbachia endosymbiont of Cruorifilaria tuberocauda]QKX01518.1 rhodanese-related sulfurtransferase [Wolbachia endosymbiont of Cruorifilaria tuberocauda]